MQVKDAMSKDLIVGYVPGTIRDALSILAKHNVSGMPVLKKDTKKVVGVVTRNDIFKKHDEEQLALIMSPDPFIINKDKEIHEAAQILYKKRIHGLPVVDKRKNLAGLIIPTDILKFIPNNINNTIKHFFTSNIVSVYQDTPITII